MKLILSSKFLSRHSCANAFLKFISSIVGISASGNTPFIKLSNKGASSEINLGTTVSQKLLNIIFYSAIGLFANSASSYIALLFKFPAEFKTDFNALNPKS